MSKNKASKAKAAAPVPEEEPEVYESSGEEWNDGEGKKRGGNRRASSRVAKKQKVKHVEESSESEEQVDEEEDEEDIDEEDSDEEFDEDDDDEDDPKGKKNGVGKKKKKENVAQITTQTHTTTAADGTKKVTTVKVISSGDYSTGSFVILKKDAQVGDKKKQPCIWRIDGKALLQKYEPLTEDGKVKHKNTSIYTGWSPLDKELYAPIMVYVHSHSNQNMVVEVNWEQLKEINMDSD